MQECMRNNDQVLGRKLVADRGNEQGVKLFQMCLCSFQKAFFQALDIVRAQPELGQLQLQQAKLLANAQDVAQRHNFELLTRNQANIKTVARGVVLNQKRIFRQNLLQL